MKQLIKVIEIEGGSLETLLNQQVFLQCVRYIYAGVLVGVNETFVKIENPRVVYETGPWSSKEWKDAQSMGIPALYIQRAAIEAFGLGK